MNPAAGRLPAREKLSRAEEWLRGQGWEVSWQETQHRGHASDLASAAAETGVAVVFACGGDGTVSEVATGLKGSRTALAVIPAGTINIWAQETGVPRDSMAAVQAGVTGVPHTVDLGLAGRQHFLLMAGLGLDARIAGSVTTAAKRRVGGWSYLLAAAPAVLSYRSTPVTVRLDGETWRARVLMLVAGNTRNYAGVAEVTPSALADDGLLDVCVFTGNGPINIIRHVTRVLRRRHAGSPDVIYRRVSSVEIVPPLPLQTDGDPDPEDCSRITVIPRALEVMIPRGPTPPVLRGDQQGSPRGLLPETGGCPAGSGAGPA